MQKRLQRKRRRRLAQALEHDAPVEGDGRERRCIVTGASGSPDGLIRFVLSPDGVVAPDFSGKLPGRGAWVSGSRDAVETAAKKNLFARALKAAAPAPDDLADRTDAGLARAALSALGLARRTGDALIGFEKVRDLLKTSKAAVLIAASDGAEDGRRKLAAAAQTTPVYALFSRDELAAALGCDGVHVAITKGPAAQRFLKAAARLSRFRTDVAG